MTTKDKVTTIINDHGETLKPIYVLLAEQSLTRKAFYQCLKDEPELSELYKEVQKQVSWIRKRMQIDKLERRLESIAHGRGKQTQTRTIRDANGNVVQTETTELVKGAACPPLLKPRRLIIAVSSTSRNTRGLGFPGWGSGVTEPISA